MKTFINQSQRKASAVGVLKNTLPMRVVMFCFSLLLVVGVALFSSCSATFRARGFDRRHGYMERNDHEHGEHRK